MQTKSLKGIWGLEQIEKSALSTWQLVSIASLDPERELCLAVQQVGVAPFSTGHQADR